VAEEEGRRASDVAASAPDPDDPRKPDSPNDLTKRSWLYVLRTTLRQYGADQCTDLAAALTYYGVLALFPALLAAVSIIGVVGNPETTTDAILGLVQGIVPDDATETVRGLISQLAGAQGAGFALIIGIGGALWSASGFVTAFSRAMNRIYGIQEGRPIWKLRPTTLAVTVFAIIVAVLAALLVAVSGPIAEQVAAALGLPSGVVIVWDIAKWLILLVLAIAVVAVLYYATPNIKQPKFRWMSVGSLVALVVWAVASVGFAIYAVNFASYDATYGPIGGIILFLLWIWISNNALLFGAELDAELERGRQLQAGIEAEETLQLPPRDTKASDKKAEQHAADVRAGRELRRQATRSNVDDRHDDGGRDGPSRR